MLDRGEFYEVRWGPRAAAGAASGHRYLSKKRGAGTTGNSAGVKERINDDGGKNSGGAPPLREFVLWGGVIL
jgi:hypothetical protein